MGTMMYSFYQHQETLPKGFNTSSIVPYFILTEMPHLLVDYLLQQYSLQHNQQFHQV